MTQVSEVKRQTPGANPLLTSKALGRQMLSGGIVTMGSVSAHLSSYDSGPKLVFVDEKKVLEMESNFFGQLVGRLLQSVVILFSFLIWYRDYSKGDSYSSHAESQLWVLTFFSIQALNFAIVHTLLIYFHSVFMAKRVYSFFFCRSEACI